MVSETNAKKISEWRDNNPGTVITEQILKNILGLHSLQYADLRFADLRYADLRYANLRYADLRYADLRYADIWYADLYDADLRFANLQYADLRYADLRYADLRFANLQYADLRYADLRYADLRHADLRYANLQYADLRYADLRFANLFDADMRGADMRGADMRDAEANAGYLESLTSITPDGSLIGWKRGVEGAIIKLRVPESAKRSNGTTRKCRAEYVEVLEIVKNGEQAKEAKSLRHRNFTYRVGETVYPDKFDTNRWDECSHGIHFYLTRAEAERHYQ